MKNICFQMNRKAWLSLVMVLCLSFPALAQKITVSGTVTDPAGEPLPGASLLVQGTSNGVQTDYDGNFQIEADANATLVVSYVGYETQNVAVNGQTTINIVLQENSVILGEVVAIGYGAVKKSDATGSVAVIKPDDIEAGISTSAQDMLVGASPGVVVTSNGGSPEGGAQIRIRGGSSLNASNDPLIVLDGVPLTNEGIQGMSNPLSMISPDNIESMTILKDASATAIYGSRASNGVIIITTKKGQSGKPQINFTANMHINTARKTWDVLNAGEFRDLITSYYGADSDVAAQLGNSNTEWQDEVLRTTISHDYSLSVGGTAGFLPYRVSASYTNNQGILKGSGMERVTAGINLTPKFFNGLLSVQANAKGYYIKNTFSSEGAIGDAIGSDPTQPVFNYAYPLAGGGYLYNGYTTVTNADGTINTNGTLNPVATIKGKSDQAEVWRSNGNLQLDYALHFLPELHFNLNLGYDVSESNENINWSANMPDTWKGWNSDGAAMRRHIYQLRRNTLLDFYVNYKKDFEAIKSNLDVMVGYSWQKFHSEGTNSDKGTQYMSAGYNSPVLNPDGTYSISINESTIDRIGTYYDPIVHWANHLQLISYFGRLNYTFDDAYLLTFTLRRDGTSRFSKENRWGLFPSLALGWKISEMDFFESAKGTMNELKMRLGWGITGQQDVGNYFPYMATYEQSKQGSYYPNMYTGTYVNEQGEVVSYTYYPLAYDPNIKWEETTTWNVGFDMGFLNNRITASLDWYLRNTKDLLSYVTVPIGSATSNEMYQNIGTLRNIGVEANIGAKPIVTKDFTWSTGFNVGWNKNEITKLNNSEDGYVTVGGISGPTGQTVQVHKTGYPAFSYSLFEQVYDQAGNPIEDCFVDQNGDGVINNDDRVIKHSADPKVTLAWNNTFNYKNWDLGISLRANIGNYVYNNVASQRTNMEKTDQYGLHNVLKSDFYFERASTETYLSSHWLENASFIRCDNITLGYTFNELLNNNLKLRLFGAVQNPFVITKYKGLDPEVAGGIDNNVYPRPITMTLGLIATF